MFEGFLCNSFRSNFLRLDLRYFRLLYERAKGLSYRLFNICALGYDLIGLCKDELSSSYLCELYAYGYLDTGNLSTN